MLQGGIQLDGFEELNDGQCGLSIVGGWVVRRKYVVGWVVGVGGPAIQSCRPW
jgi:hypothetical protein